MIFGNPFYFFRYESMLLPHYAITSIPEILTELKKSLKGTLQHRNITFPSFDPNWNLCDEIPVTNLLTIKLKMYSCSLAARTLCPPSG